MTRKLGLRRQLRMLVANLKLLKTREKSVVTEAEAGLELKSTSDSEAAADFA